VSAAAGTAEHARLIRDATALGVPLDDPQAAAMLRLLDELESWNRSFNLTAISERSGMLTHHLLDSLSIRPFLAGTTVADVGTGAGFPGLPLAIADPGRHFTLIDSGSKKIRFVAHAARVLGLTNVEPLQARVEHMRPAVPFDTVVARALAPLPRLLALVAPLCGAGTCVLAMKSSRLDAELALVAPPWELVATHILEIPGLEATRALAVLRLGGPGGGRC